MIEERIVNGEKMQCDSERRGVVLEHIEPEPRDKRPEEISAHEAALIEERALAAGAIVAGAPTVAVAPSAPVNEPSS